MKRTYNGPPQIDHGQDFRPHPFSYTKLSDEKLREKQCQLSQPKKVGHYSRNSETIEISRASNLKYLCAPGELPFDLKLGVEHVIRKDERATKARKLDDILSWIKSEESRINIRDFDIVCFRGLLTTLMVSPYENQEGWKVMAVKHKGTIYLWQEETEQKKERQLNETQQSKEMCSWGHKFEQYLCADDPGKRPNTNEPVNENEEFCCIMSTRIGQLKVLYGAEVDCIKSVSKLSGKDVSSLQSLERFVELKSSKKARNQRQEQNFRRFKLIKWWAQSFLVGIPTILCGWKDDNGFVFQLEEFSTLKIPGKCLDQWKGNVCILFLSDILSFIKSAVTCDDSETIYQFEWRPRSTVSVTTVDRSVGYTILPEWYR